MAAATLADLEDAMGQAHAMECAVRAQFLRLVGEYIEMESWAADGARSLGEWLAARFALAPYRARELARVADACRSLPAIFEAFAAGRISWDQLSTATRYATPATDAALAESLPGMSLRSIEARARRERRKSAADARREQEDDSLTMWRRGDRLRLRGDLGADLAATVEAALLRILERQPRPVEGEEPIAYDRRLALALGEVCSGAIAADPDPDLATVSLHVEATALAVDDGFAEIDGLVVSSETARRLSCDCRLEEILEFGGVPVGIGHVSRTIPHNVRRELARRDEGCRFPGCDRRRWVHAHHVWHWGKGGATDLGNLVLLCSYHHRFVHEGEWDIRGNPMGDLDFVRPDGTVFGGGPPPLSPDTRRWLWGEAA